jgi:F-type H+-transporting ATPase subunit gamma
MASLKELQIRIKTVKSTKKITAAMKMVAASKLRRVQNQLVQVRQSARITEKMLNHLMAQPWEDPIIYSQPGRGTMHVVVLIGSDRGLCGAYNTNILKEGRQCLNQLKANSEPYHVVAFGKKIHEGLKDFLTPHLTHPLEPFDHDPKILARQIIDAFDQGHIRTVRVISPRFRNVLMQQVKTTFLLPFEAESFYEQDCPPYILTEPTNTKFLQKLFERNLEATLHRLIFESFVCEQAARMTAMDTATQNASDMIDKLHLVYNRTRQAKITSELIEIISGAQAV